MLAEQAGHHLGRLGGRQVGDAVELDVAPVAHPVGDLAQLLGRGRDVAEPADGQHGRGHLGEPVTYVEPGQGLAHLDVAGVVGLLQRVQQGRAPRGLALEEARPEPALRRGAHHARGARGADPVDPLVPRVGAADLGAGAQQHRGRDPLRCVEQELEADRAADGVAGVGEGPAGSPRSASTSSTTRSTPAASSAIANRRRAPSGCGRGRGGPRRGRRRRR